MARITTTGHLKREIRYIPSGKSYLAAGGKVDCLYLPVINHGLPVTISLGCRRRSTWHGTLFGEPRRYNTEVPLSEYSRQSYYFTFSPHIMIDENLKHENTPQIDNSGAFPSDYKRTESDSHHRALKTTQDRHVVLRPQPSSDVNNPLN